MAPAGDDRRKWHFEKTINVGHLITTITVAVSVVVWAMKMDARVTVLEDARVQQARFNEKQETADKEILAAVREHLKDINAKLDKLIWERNGHGK